MSQLLLRVRKLMGFSALSSFLWLTACDHSFTCSETKTCAPSGGAANADVLEQPTGGRPNGGAAGAMIGVVGGTSQGGAAGTTGVQCVNDSDCSDSKYCTGVEKCERGACVAGLAPCPNSDAINCSATCQEAEPHCAVVAIDSDGDKHGTLLCANAPGDDCDDSQSAAYPGNTEICDGVDNDCDGKLDLAEGLPLGGTDILLESGAKSLGAVVWLPQHQSYVAIWVGAGIFGDEVYLTQFDEAGTKLGPSISTWRADKDLYSSLRVHGGVWGGDHYSLLIAEQPIQPGSMPVISWKQIYPPTRSAPAYVLPATLNPGSIPFMAREGQGSWDIVWDEGNDVVAQKLTPPDAFGTLESGGLMGTPTTLFSGARILALGSSDGFVDALVASKDGKITLDRMLGSITGNSSRTNLQQLDATKAIALYGRIASSPSATAAAWTTWETLEAESFDARLRFSAPGIPGCSSVELWKSSSALQPIGLTASPQGWVVSFMDAALAPGQRVSVYPDLLVTRVSETCTADFAQAVAVVAHNGISHASGSNSVALAWQIDNTLRIRVLPSLLCK